MPRNNTNDVLRLALRLGGQRRGGVGRLTRIADAETGRIVTGVGGGTGSPVFSSVSAAVQRQRVKLLTPEERAAAEALARQNPPA